MKVNEVIAILSKVDPNLDVAIEQIFREHRSITLRSIEIIGNCIVFKDHYTRVSQWNTFVSFDGNEYAVPPVNERMLSNDLSRVFEANEK